MTPPALTVCREGCAPDAARGRELGAVPVGNVAYTLGRQGVAGLASASVTLDQAPSINEAVHRLADATLGDAEPAGKVLTGDHRVVGHEVERPLLRRGDAEGWRSLRQPLRVGYGGALAAGRLRAQPSAGAAVRAHGLQRVAPAAEHERGAPPEA